MYLPDPYSKVYRKLSYKREKIKESQNEIKFVQTVSSKHFSFVFFFIISPLAHTHLPNRLLPLVSPRGVCPAWGCLTVMYTLALGAAPLLGRHIPPPLLQGCLWSPPGLSVVSSRAVRSPGLSAVSSGLYVVSSRAICNPWLLKGQ